MGHLQCVDPDEMLPDSALFVIVKAIVSNHRVNIQHIIQTLFTKLR